MSSAVILNTSTNVISGPLGRLLFDGASIFVAIVLNFFTVDLMYNDFDIRESIKGSYWFVLGPLLYVLGPGLAWVDAWLKAIILKEKGVIKEKLQSWLKGIFPFLIKAPPSFLNTLGDSILSEEQIKSQQEHMEYLKEIGRRKD